MGKHEVVQTVSTFERHPSSYKHWTLNVEGDIATLTLEIHEENGLRDDYLLKLNSYDLGVDIELHDASERLRFEYPQVRSVVITSALPRIFCAGANIRMLASSTHAFKVNFCRFTNETRCGLEDASLLSGQTYLAALNGTASGGGYEMAEACEEIYLIDDGSSAVSLPEVPLLGVLPGTGGLTRLVEKRKVRRDLADLFCTKAEGYRSRDALRFNLIDGAFTKSKWKAGIAQVARAAADKNPVKAERGIEWSPVQVDVNENGEREYKYVSLTLDTAGRVATLTVRSPEGPAPESAEALLAEGVNTWSLQAYRELDDALLHLRFNFDQIGLILLKTSGDSKRVLAHDARIQAYADHWFAREIALFQARTLRRVDNTARSFFALVDSGSCFAGSLFELCLAADRTYMLEDEDGEVTIEVGAASAGLYPMSTGLSRLAVRFAANPDEVKTFAGSGQSYAGPEAEAVGLVTMSLDDIDWEDDVRIAIEERVSMSPDALTGMEQNLRFVGPETCDTKIFGRLSAWQNWIFQRPNAVGESGALTLYGAPVRPSFNWQRT